MKQVNTPIFNKKIKNAIRQIQRNRIKPPNDGSHKTLKKQDTRKGTWQIDYAFDTDSSIKRPYIAAYFITHNYKISAKFREFQLRNV